MDYSTGSKAHRQLGLIQYAVKDLFNLLGIQKMKNNENRVYMSSYAVHTDKIYDLLGEIGGNEVTV